MYCLFLGWSFKPFQSLGFDNSLSWRGKIHWWLQLERHSMGKSTGCNLSVRRPQTPAKQRAREASQILPRLSGHPETPGDWAPGCVAAFLSAALNIVSTRLLVTQGTSYCSIALFSVWKWFGRGEKKTYEYLWKKPLNTYKSIKIADTFLHVYSLSMVPHFAWPTVRNHLTAVMFQALHSKYEGNYINITTT